MGSLNEVAVRHKLVPALHMMRRVVEPQLTGLQS